MSKFDEILEKLEGQEVTSAKVNGKNNAVHIETASGLGIKLAINYEDIDLFIKEFRPLRKVPKMREFNRNDWYALAGAEKFKDGSEPLIYTYGYLTIVADANGIEATVDEERAYIIPSNDEAYTFDMADEVIRATAKKTKPQLIRYFEQELGLRNNL